MDKNIATCLGFLVMGIMGIFTMVIFARQNRQVRKYATSKTTAIVTNRHRSGKYVTIYDYLVDGTKITVASKQVVASSPQVEDGDVVDLYYNPQNPTEIYVPNEQNFFYLAIAIAIFVSTLCFYAAVISL